MLAIYHPSMSNRKGLSRGRRQAEANRVSTNRRWYSWSQELNPNWSSSYSRQPEIESCASICANHYTFINGTLLTHLSYLNYYISDWQNLFDKYNLDDITHFGSTFKRADWNPDTKTYNIQFEETLNPKQKFEVECDVLISAIGGFSTPLDKPPGLRGLERFKGESFHSARWNHSIDLKGKKIGVIGNGCSAGVSFLSPYAIFEHSFTARRGNIC